MQKFADLNGIRSVQKSATGGAPPAVQIKEGFPLNVTQATYAADAADITAEPQR